MRRTYVGTCCPSLPSVHRTYVRGGPAASGLEQTQRLRHGPEGLSNHALHRPGHDGRGVLGQRIEERRRNPPALSAKSRGFLVFSALLRWHEVELRLTVHRDVTVQVDELRQAVGRTIRRPGDDHAAVAVSDEDDVSEVLVVENPHHVGYVRVEVDVRASEMRALAESREGRGEDIVAGFAQERAYPSPGVRSGPGSVHDDERCHRSTTCGVRSASCARPWSNSRGNSDGNAARHGRDAAGPALRMALDEPRPRAWPRPRLGSVAMARLAVTSSCSLSTIGQSCDIRRP